MKIGKDKLSVLSKGLLVIYMAALAFLSLNPWVRPSSEPAVGWIPWDKIDHAVAYAVLIVIAILAFQREIRGFGLLMAVAASFSAATGVLLEFCQSWLTETRSFSPFDAYANGLGAVIGVAGFWSFRFLFGSGRRAQKNIPASARRGA
jgi:VanZ family protein